MLLSEYKIKFSKFTHPWSPILAVAILSVSIFKLYLSSVKNNVSKTTIINRLYDILLSYDTPNPPPKLDTDDKEIINNKLKEASKKLTLIKRNASKHRQDHLQARTEEADLVGNDKLSYYIRRLLVIEQQVVVHKKIKQYTASVKHQSIKNLEIPKDSTIGWNNIPKTLPSENCVLSQIIMKLKNL